MQTQTLSVNKKCVFVSQRGNPVLKHIRSVPWEFGDIVADYEMGTKVVVLIIIIVYCSPFYGKKMRGDMSH